MALSTQILSQGLKIDEEIKNLVCEDCWNSPFTSDAFQILLASGHSSESKGFSYMTTWEAIHTSATHGCNWCKLLAEKGTNHVGDCKITVSLGKETTAYTPAGTKRLTLNTYGKSGSSYSFYPLYTTLGDNAGQYITPKDRVLEVNAPSSYGMARECFHNCVNFHERCPKPQKTILPDRVLDCFDPVCPKLVLTNGKIEDIYATLSYVWGERQPEVTRTTNIDTFVNKGIEVEKLTKTLQDAIKSTHALGIRYLWIDALCILQDVDDDKMQQMAKMNVIYRNAYVTIIAASAQKASEGFLQDRPARIPAAQIPFICQDGTMGTARLATVLYDHYDATRVYHEVLEPASNRAWCLQERVLSERCYIFASDTLKYSCQTEVVSIGDALCEPSSHLRLPESVFFPKSCAEMSDEELTNARTSWRAIIWDYTRRGMAKGGVDKLNALGGVAEQFQQIWRTNYWAGLWEHTLLEDLLWRLSVAAEAAARPEKYCAPSWSWASVDGIVDVPNLEAKSESGVFNIGKCKVLKCGVTLGKKESPFGAVLDAHLKLDAQLHEAKLVAGEELFIIDTTSPEGKHVGWLQPDSVDDTLRNVSQVWIVPIIWDKGHTFVEALVLARVASKESNSGVFRRVGYFLYGGLKDLTWLDNGTSRVFTIL